MPFFEGRDCGFFYLFPHRRCQRRPTSKKGLFYWRKMEKTAITPIQLSKMTDAEFLAHCRKFPFPSQWTNYAAYSSADYRLALIQGARYVATGKTDSFKAKTWR